MKELPPNETKDNNKTFKSFKTVGLSTPFPVYGVHHTANESVVRLRFPEENNVSPAIAVPQCVVSMQFVGGAKEMLLKCLRITENKLMSITQIRMPKNRILKNIQSFSTERVLHDPAELFVHLCVSTCYGKR